MIKKLKKIFFLMAGIFALMLATSSCNDELDLAVEDRETGEGLIIVTNPTGGTRATTSVLEDKYNENKIDALDLFIYPADADANTGAVYAKHLSELSAKTEAHVVVRIPTEFAKTLFGTGQQECRVYVVANCKETSLLGEGITISDLNETITYSRMGIDDNAFRQLDENNKRIAPPNFVMVGSELVQYNWETNEVKGIVPIKRIASKIRLAFKIPDSVSGKDENGNVISEWVPDISGARLYFNNGANKARLDGEIPEMNQEDYFSISPVVDKESLDYLLSRQLMETSDPAIKDEYPYWNELPFYTYPREWTNLPGESRRCNVILMVPWSARGGTSVDFKETYYQIPLNSQKGSDDKINCLESNKYYRSLLNVSMLGSFDIKAPTELECSYEILDWFSEGIDVAIKDYRYLVVNQPEWEMNNIEDLTVPFFTSHKVAVANVKLTYFRYNDEWTGKNEWYIGEPHVLNISPAQLQKTFEKTGEWMYECSVDNSKNTVKFNHPLCLWIDYKNDRPIGYLQDNNKKKYYDGNIVPDYFVPDKTKEAFTHYEIEITIVHEDMLDEWETTRFKQVIKINQYPAAYITAERNDGQFKDYPGYGGTGNEYMMINGYKSSFNWNSLPLVYGSSVGTTVYGNYFYVHSLAHKDIVNNDNMYIVHLTQLMPGEDEKWSIGDPRSLNFNNRLDDSSFTQGDVSANWVGKTGTTASTLYDWTFAGVHYYVTCPAPTFAPGIEGGGNRQMKYYYPTDEVNSKSVMIAPVLRVASSFSTCSINLTHELARRRCATYQEMGYPAGRWRLPTAAEVEYVAKLSAEAKMPRLYGSSAGGEARYHCANGTYTVNPDAGTVTLQGPGERQDGGVRCVYDEWFWRDEDGTPDKCPKTVFTWGDRYKDNPQKKIKSATTEFKGARPIKR